MERIKVVLDEDPSSENDETLINRLFKYETEELLHDVPKHISLYLQDESQKIVGGVLIWIHTESIYIPTVWVDENLRHKGYGKKLLQAAEEEGRKRGCKYVTLDANFQSASFYVKQDYHVIGEIKNYIFKHTKTYFRKSLVASSGQEIKEINFNDIKLVPAPLKDYPIIQNMARFYVYDMSQYMGNEDGWECPEDGLYECIDFKKYWQADDAFPFLIRYKNELAGFVIIDKKGSEPKIDFNVAQFFILRKFKNKGIGKYVAHQCFDKFRGAWEVMVMSGNDGAYQFWQSIISEYTNNNFDEYTKKVKHLNDSLKNIFYFNSKHPSSV